MAAEYVVRKSDMRGVTLGLVSLLACAPCKSAHVYRSKKNIKTRGWGSQSVVTAALSILLGCQIPFLIISLLLLPAWILLFTSGTCWLDVDWCLHSQDGLSGIVHIKLALFSAIAITAIPIR